MKLSVSSYSFAQYLRDGRMRLIDCVGKAKEMGFDAIEFIDIPGETTDAVKETALQLRHEAERVGIAINAYTVGANLFSGDAEADAREVARLKRQVDVAALLGAEVMRHDVCRSLMGKGEGRSFDGMLPTIAKNAREVTAYAASLGIRTCSENHGFVAQDSDRVERLFNAVAHDNYGILVDMGNFLCVDEDPVIAVSRLAPYAIHVHAKDFLVSEENKEGYTIFTRGANYLKPCAIGEGVVPVKKCLSVLKRAGYNGYLSLEYEGAADCLEGIARGLAKLKEYFS
ncbi:MAG: sugar phosphate isomerase/epimerase [Clostridia bacterium]|nr:sugar phosphate isomerase/epimerase [Clostridia bacterium]MBO5755775.1 sugar phosphate isomerase/epimerase [Clostridia bacterium]MBO7169940.1 sugar phosphate isomerase/epimerase [Clostridia bacterium]